MFCHELYKRNKLTVEPSVFDRSVVKSSHKVCAILIQTRFVDKHAFDDKRGLLSLLKWIFFHRDNFLTRNHSSASSRRLGLISRLGFFLLLIKVHLTKRSFCDVTSSLLCSCHEERDFSFDDFIHFSSPSIFPYWWEPSDYYSWSSLIRRFFCCGP